MIAAIDVGSNTVRMLLGEVDDGKVVPHRYEREITRLKGGQTGEGLAPEAMERTFSALKRFAVIASEEGAARLRAVGTEALRTASNGAEFVDMVRREADLEIEIIDGLEEAGLSAAGVLSALDAGPKNAIIIDIGGGSTEIILVCQGNVAFRHSCPLGVVQIAEMGSNRNWQAFITDQTSRIGQLIQQKQIADIVKDSETLFVGTAGTVTTLAAIDLEMATYDWRRVNNYVMSREMIEEIMLNLQRLSTVERENITGMEKGRGDLIIPGISVLQAMMKMMDKESLVISDFGLLEGVLLQLV